MKKLSLRACCMASVVVAAMTTASTAGEPESCKKVRLAEPGWNDLAFTTGVATKLLTALGYEVNSSVLGIDVIYASLKNKDLDVFLGYWDPAMVTYYKPYKEDGSVETVGINLEGAKYTFAVPTYAWNAGVKDFKDLQKFADQFEKKMYGIEAGSNQLMFDAIKDQSLGLDGWEVIESSEVGMLTELERKAKNQEFMVFQGWAPHPMNAKFDFKYLTGGDKFYGPNFGAATVSTQVRSGYMQECPNVAQLLKNLKFDVEFENSGMAYLIDDGLKPEEAGEKAIKTDAKRLDAWLANVKTFDGNPAADQVRAALGL